LRSEIDGLERGLIEAANSKAKWNLHEVAHTLRWRKGPAAKAGGVPRRHARRKEGFGPILTGRSQVFQSSLSATSATAGQGSWKVARSRNYGLLKDR
jgi:hypothetical protein